MHFCPVDCKCSIENCNNVHLRRFQPTVRHRRNALASDFGEKDKVGKYRVNAQMVLFSRQRGAK